MKRILAVFLCFAALASLTGCVVSLAPKHEAGNHLPDLKEDHAPASSSPAGPALPGDATDGSQTSGQCYECIKSANGHGDFWFYYENGELARAKYIAFYKGMPEATEYEELVKNYSGVEMVDITVTSRETGAPVECFAFEIDMSQDGMRYLKDSFDVFDDVSDTSWDHIKNVMESDGYTCIEHSA